MARKQQDTVPVIARVRRIERDSGSHNNGETGVGHVGTMAPAWTPMIQAHQPQSRAQ